MPNPTKKQVESNPFSEIKFEKIPEFRPPVAVEVSSLYKVEPAVFEESKLVTYQKKDLPENLQFKRAGGKGKKMVKVDNN